MSTVDNSGRSQIEDFDLDQPVSEIDELAATWLIRMTSGNVTAEQRAEFARWRAADPAHEAAISEMRTLWSSLPLDAAAPVHAPQPRRVPVRRRARIWALAASLMLGVGLAYLSVTDWRFDQATGAGEVRTVALEDGSSLVLSGDTALDVDLRDDLRRVVLHRGEVYFEVQHDAQRPFVIDAGDAEVRVVGTHFRIRRDADAVEVLVAEGRVSVSDDQGTVMLDAGQQVASSADGLSAVAAANAERELAWLSGRLILEGVTLEETALLLNRYQSKTKVVLLAADSQRRFNTVVDLRRVDEWLVGVEQQGRGRVARLGSVAFIY